MTKYMVLGNGENLDTVFGSKDCRKYSFLGTAVQCMGSQYATGNVTKTQMKFYLTWALDQLSSTETYTSVEVVTGMETRFVAGTQKHVKMNM